MKLYTFTAETPSKALQKAQSSCGTDALVVNTKMIKKKTFSSDGLYEVVVAVEDTKDVNEKNPTLDKKQHQKVQKSVEQIKKIDSLTVFDEETTSSVEIKRLEESLKSVNGRLVELQELFLEAQRSKNLAVPPEFREIYNKLKRVGINQEDIDEIVGESIKHMPTYMKSSSETMKRYFKVLLKKIIPIKKEQKSDKQRVIMFVGPTGVGKTTTLAKLAARYSLLEYNYKVGIITLDTYRIGAVEQLYQYAKMMKLPIEDAIGVEDFKDAIHRFSNMDIILIDSVGSSQYDREKLKKLKEFVDSTNLDIEMNLVLSSNAKYEDLEDTFNSFKFLGLKNMIITKLDESKKYGNIFSLIKKTKLPVSYFSTGQEVPDDIRVASSGYFIDCLFEGYKK